MHKESRYRFTVALRFICTRKEKTTATQVVLFRKYAVGNYGPVMEIWQFRSRDTFFIYFQSKFSPELHILKASG